MKGNILLVGLDYGYIKCVAKELSGIFDMHYLDIKDLISYNLINEQNVLDKAGVEYYKEQVHKIVLSAGEYENTIINIPYDLFLEEDVSKILNESCLSIFVNLNKKTIIENDKKLPKESKNSLAIIVFEEYCTLLKEKTNINIECDDNIVETINIILEKLKTINLTELK